LIGKDGAKKSAVKAFPPALVFIVLFGVMGSYFRECGYRINYALISQDLVNDYYSVLSSPQEDMTKTKEGITSFMEQNGPVDIQDSVREKCRLISNLTISSAEDLKSFCSMSSPDTIFAFSSKTNELHDDLVALNQRAIADSCTLPIARHMDSENGDIYVTVMIAIGFADESALARMRSGLIEMQEAAKLTYSEVFKEDLK
jgi:hypothetical protein